MQIELKRLKSKSNSVVGTVGLTYVVKEGLIQIHDATVETAFKDTRFTTRMLSFSPSSLPYVTYETM